MYYLILRTNSGEKDSTNLIDNLIENKKPPVPDSQYK
jgi:hypothetical protein